MTLYLTKKEREDKSGRADRLINLVRVLAVLAIGLTMPSLGYLGVRGRKYGWKPPARDVAIARGAPLFRDSPLFSARGGQSYGLEVPDYYTSDYDTAVEDDNELQPPAIKSVQEQACEKQKKHRQSWHSRQLSAFQNRHGGRKIYHFGS